MRFLWVCACNIFVSWSRYNLIFLCFYLKTSYLTFSVNSLTLNPHATAMDKAYQTCIFSVGHITVGTLAGTSALCLGSTLNSSITDKKQTNEKNVALRRLYRQMRKTWHWEDCKNGTLVYRMRAETRRQSVASSDLSWERVCQDALCLRKCEKRQHFFLIVEV